MHPFRKYILDYSVIGTEEWTQVEKCLTRKVYSKGAVVLEGGKICRKLYFLESGFLRYFVLKNGEEVTKYFTVPPYCFTVQQSFTNETPSPDTIQTLEESVVWEMNKVDAFDLFRFTNWNTFVRKLIQEVQFKTEQILEDLQSLTAEERYIKLIEEQSIFIEKVPLKHLASFLGIAPQSLSRIRKKYFEDQRKLT